MKVANAFITSTKEDIPLPKVITLNDENDLLRDCNIKGGQITSERNVLFIKCIITNCEYKVKEYRPPLPPGPVVDSCIIKDCKLPHAYYVRCRFEGENETRYVE